MFQDLPFYHEHWRYDQVGYTTCRETALGMMVRSITALWNVPTSDCIHGDTYLHARLQVTYQVCILRPCTYNILRLFFFVFSFTLASFWSPFCGYMLTEGSDAHLLYLFLSFVMVCTFQASIPYIHHKPDCFIGINFCWMLSVACIRIAGHVYIMLQYGIKIEIL